MSEIFHSIQVSDEVKKLVDDTFIRIGKKTKCQHLSTKGIEGYDRTPRGRVDVELCEDCNEVLSRKVVR
jgi:hypothetical protein